MEENSLTGLALFTGKIRTVAVLVAGFCAILAASSVAAPVLPPGAVNPASQEEAAAVGFPAGQLPAFIYNRERPDPFYPFLTQEIIKAEAKAKAELAGPRKFEPSQLVLVAIVAVKNGFVAMAQDASGAGYVLRKGTRIGETGKVIQVGKERVVVEQVVKNVFGERVTKKIEMTLNKEEKQ